LRAGFIETFFVRYPASCPCPSTILIYSFLCMYIADIWMSFETLSSYFFYHMAQDYEKQSHSIYLRRQIPLRGTKYFPTGQVPDRNATTRGHREYLLRLWPIRKSRIRGTECCSADFKGDSLTGHPIELRIHRVITFFFSLICRVGPRPQIRKT